MKTRISQPDLYQIEDFKNLAQGSQILRKCLNKFYTRKGYDAMGQFFPFIRIRAVGNCLDVIVIGKKIEFNPNGLFVICNEDLRLFQIKEKLKEKSSVDNYSFKLEKNYDIEIPTQEFSFIIEQKANLETLANLKKSNCKVLINQIIEIMSKNLDQADKIHDLNCKENFNNAIDLFFKAS